MQRSALTWPNASSSTFNFRAFSFPYRIAWLGRSGLCSVHKRFGAELVGGRTSDSLVLCLCAALEGRRMQSRKVGF